LETHFTNHAGTQHLVGNRVTLADIVVLVSLSGALAVSLTEEKLKPYPKTRAWIGHLLSDKHFAAVLGDRKIPETFTPPAQ